MIPKALGYCKPTNAKAGFQSSFVARLQPLDRAYAWPAAASNSAARTNKKGPPPTMTVD
jgi:hypothetical protein